jgi:drug/metabolite transporter (DMT)-like permease
MKNENIKNFLLLLLLASLWGPSFLFIKVAVEYIPPITIANLRIGIGAIFLFIILKIQKNRLPKFGIIWKHFAIVALFSSAIPFCLFGIGEQYIDSSLAAILNGTTPLATLLIAHFSTQSDRLTKAKFLGAIIGFSGLFILVLPSLFGASATLFGIFCIIGATTCYGTALVYAKKHIRGFKPLVVPTAQLLLATLFLLPFSLILEKPLSITYISDEAIASIFGLAILGTAFAFVVYYKIIEATSATYASSVTYIIPIFGMILGVLVLNEKLAWNSYLGSAVILSGVMIANGVFKKIKS